MLTIVEKVLFLQDVDIFKDTSTEDLAHVAAITNEVNFRAQENVYNEGDVSDSMYMVIGGIVHLHHQKQQAMIAMTKDVFGTWALFDEETRVATATTVEETRLLKIYREDFYDLLADHIRITEGVLKNLSRRLRGLLGRVKIDLEQGR